MTAPTHDIDAFRKEYVELCLKHGFEIGACGCCSSPWITRDDHGNVDNDTVPTIPWPKKVKEEWPTNDFNGDPMPPFSME